LIIDFNPAPKRKTLGQGTSFSAGLINTRYLPFAPMYWSMA